MKEEGGGGRGGWLKFNFCNKENRLKYVKYGELKKRVKWWRKLMESVYFVNELPLYFKIQKF